MDLSAIKPVTIDVRIQHPGTGVETGLVIKIASRQSEAVKTVTRRHLDKHIARRGKKMTIDDLETQNTEILTAAVTGWEWNGDASWGGKKLELTPENVAEILAVEWIRRQIEEATADEADFFTS